MASVLLKAIEIFFWILYALIFVRILLSWLPALRMSVISRSVYMLTEPLLGPIRSLIAKSPLGGPGMILDFSPIIAYVLMEIVQSLLRILILSTLT